MSIMSDRHQVTPYPLRMDAELRDRITEAAKANNRSLNAEIIERLQRSFPERKRKEIPMVPVSNDVLLEHLAGLKEMLLKREEGQPK